MVDSSKLLAMIPDVMQRRIAGSSFLRRCWSYLFSLRISRVKIQQQGTRGVGLGTLQMKLWRVAVPCWSIEWIFIISDFFRQPVHKDTELALKAAEIRNREERELKNSSMWRISFSFYICLVQYRKFLLKKNCELEELFQKWIWIIWIVISCHVILCCAVVYNFILLGL